MAYRITKTNDYESFLDNYVPAKIEEAKVHIHLVHGDLYPKPPAYTPYTLFSQLKDSPADFTFAGHVHADLLENRVGKTLIINRGSMTRGTFNTDSIKRTPTIFILDTDTKKIQYFELKSAAPASQIFDIQKKQDLERAESELNNLGSLIKMEAGNLELSGPDSVRQIVKEMHNIKDTVKEKILVLLDKAEEI